MKKQLVSLSLVFAMVLSPLATTVTQAKTKPKEQKTEINYEQNIQELDQRTSLMLEKGVTYSKEKSAEQFKISDNGYLLSSETVIYNEDGTVKAQITNEFGNQPTSDFETYVVVSDGPSYSWDLIGTEYGTNKLDKDAYNVALILLGGLNTYVKVKTVQAVATVTLGALAYFGQPTVYYYKQLTYVDKDAVNDYVKTITYTYSDSSRTKLVATSTKVQKFTR